MIELVILDKSINLNNSKMVCFWNDARDCQNSDSFYITSYLEEFRIEIKRDFIRWIEKIDLAASSKLNVKNKMKLEDGFSFWWMSGFIELSNFSKSQSFNQVIKLFALSHWLDRNHIDVIDIQTSNYRLASAIKTLCHKKGIKFKTNFNFRFIGDIFFSSFLNVGQVFKILIWLPKFLFNNFWLYSDKSIHNFNTQASLSFFSYFNSYNKQALIEESFFESSYWGGLSRHLKNNGIPSNWIHISLNNEKSKLKNIGFSIETLIKNLNQAPNNFQNHIFLESFISIKIIFKSLLKFSKISFTALFIRKKFTKKVLFFNAISDEYVRSFHSHHTLESIIYFYLVKEFCKKLPTKHKVIHLYENLPWEKPLNFFTREYSDSLVFGCCHTNIRFWDLRYSFKHNLNKTLASKKLIPDFYCTNGPHQKNSLINDGFSKDSIKEVEALRFEYLLERSGDSSSTELMKIKDTKKPKTILILGCYIHENTNYLLNLISELNLDEFYRIYFKPHPALSHYKNIKNKNVLLADNSFIESIKDIDYVICSSVTTGALDAYLLRKRVFIYMKRGDLNMSPLRDIDNNVFIYNKEKFHEILIDKNMPNPKMPLKIEDFYTFDENYSGWNEVLGIEYKNV